MKKCASCTKDLPDAALHCVFCGAKQPPAPAVQQGLAKTAFGYSANDVLDQARQGRPPPTPPAPPYNPPPPQRAGHVPAALAPTGMHEPFRPPAPNPPPTPQPQPYPPPAGPQAPFVPPSSANAATMFVQGPGPAPQAPSYLRPNPPPSAMAATLVPPPAQPMAVAVPQPRMQAPIMPIPAAQPPPWIASQTASRVIRPIDPWQDSLRAMMFLWGLALLAAFATPLATSPGLVFNWKVILEGAGMVRLPPLMLAAIGFLSVVVAFIPMPSAPRGLIAAVLGLGGIAVPIALGGVPAWQPLAMMIGTLLLVPGLLIRDEYRDAMIPRLLVTLGAIGILAPSLVPQNGAIPLVSVFKALIDLPGTQKVAPALVLGQITIVVMSLLAWLPAPATGAAKLWAWLVILWALILHGTDLALAGHIGDAVTGAPNATLISWVAGSPGVLGSAYLVLVGYGLAAVIGRQLE